MSDVVKAPDIGGNAELDPPSSTRLGLGSWVLLAVLVSLLLATVCVVYLAWTSAGDGAVPTSGYIAMGLGVVFSLAVGFGLMALVFYSSRRGYDEPPVMIIHQDRSRALDGSRAEVGTPSAQVNPHSVGRKDARQGS